VLLSSVAAPKSRAGRSLPAAEARCSLFARRQSSAGAAPTGTGEICRGRIRHRDTILWYRNRKQPLRSEDSRCGGL